MLIEDRKELEGIDECITEVRRLIAANDFEGALARVKRGLSLYPRQDRIIQLRHTIEKELNRVAGGKNRLSDLDDLRRLDQESKLASDLEARSKICRNALDIVGRYPDDREFDSLASIFRDRLDTISRRIRSVDPNRFRSRRPLHLQMNVRLILFRCLFPSRSRKYAQKPLAGTGGPSCGSTREILGGRCTSTREIGGGRCGGK